LKKSQSQAPGTAVACYFYVEQPQSGDGWFLIFKLPTTVLKFIFTSRNAKIINYLKE
jgi:hypothetical protein